MSGKIMLWCGDAPNQRALACKIAKRFNLAGIIVENKKKLHRRLFRPDIISKLAEKIFFYKIEQAWLYVQRSYAKLYPEFPPVPIIRVDDINSNQASEFVSKINPDIVMVSGTNMVKERMLQFGKRMKILNLLTTDFVYFDGSENLNTIHMKVMEQAHDLYLKAVGMLISNPELCPSIRQPI